MDCICIIEFWFRSYIYDDVVVLNGFNIIRKDRVEFEYGGVCVYVNDTINFVILDDLYDLFFEMFWIKFRLIRFLRGCICTILSI